MKDNFFCYFVFVNSINNSISINCIKYIFKFLKNNGFDIYYYDSGP